MICGSKIRSTGKCKKHGFLNGRCRSRSGFSPKRADQWNDQNYFFCKRVVEKKVLQINQIKLLNILLNSLEPFASEKKRDLSH
jgi:hypothetical protein